MTERPSKTKLSGAEPQVFVSDIEKSCAFYRDKLGFTGAFVYGEPAFYAQVFRDEAKLNLRHLDEPFFDTKLREQECLLSATITLEDAESLFREFQATEVKFEQELKTEEWGARTFLVRDPDGNLILFAGRA